MADKLPEIRFTEHYGLIPETFYCSDSNSTFQNCTTCGKELIDSNETYIIEKAIKNYQETNVKDVIFEYAMCIECLEKMRKSFSPESLERINNYILQNSDLENRRKSLIETDNLNFDDWISNCIVNNKSTDELPEYQIMCQCQGAFMLYTYMPYMLSCDAAETMQELLSQKTKDELRDFYNQNLSIPPELREIFNSKVPIF